MVFPLALGKGKRLFAEGAPPVYLRVVECRTTGEVVVLRFSAEIGGVRAGRCDPDATPAKEGGSRNAWTQELREELRERLPQDDRRRCARFQEIWLQGTGDHLFFFSCLEEKFV